MEGTICFLPAVISLLLALQWGGSTYPVSNFWNSLPPLFSHVWSKGDKDTALMRTVTPETPLFMPFPALALSLLGNY